MLLLNCQIWRKLYLVKLAVWVITKDPSIHICIMYDWLVMLMLCFPLYYIAFWVLTIVPSTHFCVQVWMTSVANVIYSFSFLITGIRRGWQPRLEEARVAQGSRPVPPSLPGREESRLGGAHRPLRQQTQHRPLASTGKFNQKYQCSYHSSLCLSEFALSNSRISLRPTQSPLSLFSIVFYPT